MFVTVSQNAILLAYENDFANSSHEFAGMKKLESNSSNLQLSNVKWPAEMHPTISWNSCLYTTHSITKPSTVRSLFSFENVLHFQPMNSQFFCCCRHGSRPIKDLSPMFAVHPPAAKIIYQLFMYRKRSIKRPGRLFNFRTKRGGGVSSIYEAFTRRGRLFLI